MIDRWPALIAHCANVADVISAVNFARGNNLLVAVRGGGHSVPGFGTCDGGIVIDLSRMRGIRVEAPRQSVRTEGGCTWGDLNHATHAFGFDESNLFSAFGIPPELSLSLCPRRSILINRTHYF